MKDARRGGPGSFRLCFRSLFDSGRGYAFPCDDKGQVDVDELSERARNNYFYARAMIGRELAVPIVESQLVPAASIERKGEDQVHPRAFAGLPANGEAARHVVENVERAQRS
jgi:hypothetical protein